MPQRAVQSISYKKRRGRDGSPQDAPVGGHAGGKGHKEQSGLSGNSCCGPMELHKSRDSRRRDSKMNGADIYVARVTKRGMGSAKPCWRCLHWCYWAGIKRIFHWDEVAGRWEVVKVNSPGRDQYETTADARLHAGMVSTAFHVTNDSLLNYK